MSYPARAEGLVNSTKFMSLVMVLEVGSSEGYKVPTSSSCRISGSIPPPSSRCEKQWLSPGSRAWLKGNRKNSDNNHRHFVVPSARIPLTISRLPPYRSSLLAGPQGYTPYPHRAAVCKCELVALPLLGHVKGSIGVHHLWAPKCLTLKRFVENFRDHVTSKHGVS